MTTTSGRVAASVSKSRRNAHAVSSGEPPPSRVPIAPWTSRAATSPCPTPGEQRGDVTCVAHDVGEREVGDALAVGGAAADEDARLGRERTEQLARESRLADPGSSDDRRERRGAIGGRGVEGRAQPAELLAAPDERRRDRARERRHIRPEPQEPVGGERLALPLRIDRRRRLGVDDVRHRCVRRDADQHLTGRRRLLESRCDVDRVTGGELLIGCRAAHDHLTGVDAGTRDDPDAVLTGKLVVQPADGVADLGRRPNGAQRVVLVHDGHPEDGHHRVADELLDGAAVPLEHVLHDVEVSPHHATQELCVEPLSERGRVGDVGEEDGDDLARLRGDTGARKVRAAAGTEPCRPVVLAAAGRAGHGREPTGCGVGSSRAPPRHLGDGCISSRALSFGP